MVAKHYRTSIDANESDGYIARLLMGCRIPKAFRDRTFNNWTELLYNRNPVVESPRVEWPILNHIYNGDI